MRLKLPRNYYFDLYIARDYTLSRNLGWYRFVFALYQSCNIEGVIAGGIQKGFHFSFLFFLPFDSFELETGAKRRKRANTSKKKYL